MIIPKNYPYWKQPIFSGSAHSTFGRPFEISGGPLSGSILMGGYLIDKNGFVIAVTNDVVNAERLAAMYKMLGIMRKLDIAYHIRERYDDGYIVCSDDDWDELSELMDALLEE